MSEPGKKRHKEALENRMDAPDTRRERRDAHADAAGHQDVEPARLGAITLRCEDRRVLEKILRIEIAFPPLRPARQKKTGSR